MMSVVEAVPILSVVAAGSADESENSSAVSVVVSAIPNADSPWEADTMENGLDEQFQEVELVRSLDGVHVDRVETWNTLYGIRIVEDDDVSKPPSVKSNKPFQRWMKTLHRRALQRQNTGGTYDGGVPGQFPTKPSHRFSHHRKSSSGSSAAFFTTTRSASVSYASTSVWSRSRRNLRSSRGHSNAGRSSRASVSGARMSTDSTGTERMAIDTAVIDPAVIDRSLQRRRILEELIETEEGYIGDVRFLMNVYITILASLPTLAPGLRSSINQNLTDIVQLHEDLLGDLHRVVPHSEYTQLDLAPTATKPDRGHKRWRSLDAVPEDKVGLTWLQAIPGMTAEPQVAADVAKVFSKKMKRFFIYEEYGAKYELMIKDIASAHRTMPKWESYQKGLEALAAALGTGKNQADHSHKKSLTIGDLLVKPIQRVCKYPLLFAELLKYTPVCDCPHSHMEIEDTLIRLREATAEINRATDDTRIKATLEKTWILQDRLVFPNQSLDAVSKNIIRSFGHIQLCGTLHVCWQTKESVTGQYMVALLYRDWLCLALASRADQIYTIQACINISTAKLEEVDNGKGIQCHTAPYSWKVVFISDHQLYEVILTACTSKEEQEWRAHLSHAAAAETSQSQGGAPLAPVFDSLSLDIKPLGTVFRKPGTIARRLSVHRATTVGSKTPLCQIVLKNTSVVPSASTSNLSGMGGSSSINRSMSLLTTNTRVPVLAPPRGERARLEALLSDVWTRDILPFPGITARSRSEQLVKSSAGAMMKRFSVASLTGSFKRSGSRESIWHDSEDTLASSNPHSRNSTKQTSLSLDGEQDLARSSFLESIPDEDKSSHPCDTPSDLAPDSEWGADVLRIIGHMVDEARKERDREEGLDAPPSPIGLRPVTPAGGHRKVKRRASTLTAKSPLGSEKDVSPRRLSRKWARVRIGSVRHKETAKGFRGLFR